MIQLMNARQQDVKLANENNIADRSIFHRLINYMVKRTQNKSVNVKLLLNVSLL